MKNSQFSFFWKLKHNGEIYSQWFLSPFVLEGIKFNCAEQYMMWKKAMLFGDTVQAAKILAEPKPEKHKELGRGVQPYVDAVWVAARYDIVKAGNVAKFEQNPELMAQLKATKPAILVEASPVDLVWGIGYAEDHPNASEPSTWRGKNLLGKLLTEIRDES